MKLDTKELQDGLHTGKEVWICDWRFNDFNNKAIRHVKPTKVRIKNIQETSKRIYYSDCFFGDDKKKSVAISLFDNTGYRTYPGTALQCFTEENECKNAYEIARKENLKKFIEYKNQVIKRLEQLEKEFRC